MKSSHETIAVEGGADGKTRQDAWYNTCHLVWLAIKHIPREHRRGWYDATLHATLRRAGHTIKHTPAETAYLTWSRHKHTTPTARSMAQTNRMGA